MPIVWNPATYMSGAIIMEVGGDVKDLSHWFLRKHGSHIRYAEFAKNRMLYPFSFHMQDKFDMDPNIWSIDPNANVKSGFHLWLIVDAEDTLTATHGFSWGLEIAYPWEQVANCSTRIPDPGSRKYYYWLKGTVPGAIKWIDGAEKEAARFVRLGFTEALMEVPNMAIIHWAHEVKKYENYDSSLITGPNAAQERESLQENMSANLAKAKANLKEASTTALRLRRELDEEFEGTVGDFKKVLDVTHEFVDGSFGKDWHLKGFHLGDPIDVKENRSGVAEGYRDYLYWGHKAYEQDLGVEKQGDFVKHHHYGTSVNHLDTAVLKPFFKKYPRFARIYHIPVEN